MLWYNHVTELTVHVQNAFKAFGEATVPTIVAVVVKSQLAIKKRGPVICATLGCGETFAKTSVIEILNIALFVTAMTVSGTRV